MKRVYLDHNATTPLRPEARVAMLAAMDVVGNPSSVHGEGRAAKALVERARSQVASLVGCEPSEVVFTSGATEAAALATAGKEHVAALAVEHDCVLTQADEQLPVGTDGAFRYPQSKLRVGEAVLTAVQAANSETGILQPIGNWMDSTPHLIDAVQAAGKIPFDFGDCSAQFALLSAHKFGGPKGIGALVVRRGLDVAATLRGGGQEMGRRSGTENTIGIAGFGAAAEAAARDVSAGKWDQVAEFRNILESALEAGEKKTIFVGKDASRLPNTSCIIADGWKGETQVMQMDLAGFAISAGSACSSGKVKASTVLQAMGFNESQASSAIRVSLGLETTKEDVLRFADTWLAKRRKHNERAA